MKKPKRWYAEHTLIIMLIMTVVQIIAGAFAIYLDDIRLLLVVIALGLMNISLSWFNTRK